MRPIVVLLGALSVIGVVGPAEALRIQFYPPSRLYAYEVDATRELRSVVLQNVAVINDGEGQITVSQVHLDLISQSTTYETQTVHAPQLERMAEQASGLQAAGVLKLVAFQFGGPQLIPDDVRVSSTRTLKSGEALLLVQRTMSFSGQRDALRVRVQSSAGDSEASIPISIERSRTAFALPLRGTWLDGSGPSLHTHHRWVVPQEFAHDFMRIGQDGLAYRAQGTRFSDYYAYGEPVFAAAAGRVSAVLNDEPEDLELMQHPEESMEAYLKRILARQNEQLARGVRGIVGNHVLIAHENEYSMYAHLKPGTVRVKVGDTVKQGQQIGSVGSSGSSTEPHLHFHVCDAPDVLMCAGIPIRFEDVEIYGALQPRQLQSGDLVRNRSKERQ